VLQLDLDPYANIKGGTWIGRTPNSVNSHYFNPKIASTGFHWVLYSVYDPDSAIWLTDSVQIEVYDTLHLNFSYYQSICDNYNPIDLDYYISPGGGDWSSPELTLHTGNILNPLSAGKGKFHLIYSWYQYSTKCTFKDTFEIEILPAPVVTVSASDTQTIFCRNDHSIQLKGLPVGGFWDGAGIENDSFFNPKNPSLLNGVNKVYYYFTDSLSYCFGYDSLEFILLPIPEISIKTTAPLCYPQPYFVEAETKYSSKTTWFTHNWNASGLYGSDISKLTVRYDPGLEDALRGYFYLFLEASTLYCGNFQDSQKFYLLPHPQINFEVDKTTGYKPLTVQFKDKTLLPGSQLVGWEYYFGDDSYSLDDPDPVHIYEKAGNYTVLYKVRTKEGCNASLTKSKLVKVEEKVGWNEEGRFNKIKWYKEDNCLVIINENSAFSPLYVQIYTISGELIFTGSVHEFLRLDVNEWHGLACIIRVTTPSGENTSLKFLL